jgi:hypothetical protein
MTMTLTLTMTMTLTPCPPLQTLIVQVKCIRRVCIHYTSSPPYVALHYVP